MRATRHRLDPLLRPRSIALVGVSRDSGRRQTIGGNTILQALIDFGYDGRIDLVHPSGEPVAGRPSSRSIGELPATPDALILTLPAAAVPAAVAEAGSRGVAAVVVLAAGFSELADAEGIRLGQELADAAAATALQVCGPNGLGYLNVCDKVLAGYFPSLLSGARPKRGGLGIVTQSGAIGNSLLARAIDRGIGISFIISSGNETNVSLADYVDFLVADPQTKAISLYLEGVSDAPRFVAALRSAAAAGKPVIAYKVGKTAQGARAALSHTAKIAGEPTLYRGVFRQVGAIEATRLDDLLDIPMLVTKVGAALRKPPTTIGVVSISGGLGAVVTDHFNAEGFDIPTLGDRTRQRLEALPVKLGSTANPVDTTAAIQRTETTIKDILAIVAADDRIDAIVFPNAARFPEPALNVANIIADAALETDKPVLSIWYAGQDNGPAVQRLHRSERVACFDDPGHCARALAAYRDFLLWQRRGGVARTGVLPTPRAVMPIVATPRGILDEFQGKSMLRAYGVPLPAESLARSEADAVSAASRLGYPVALKIVSAAIPHKARAGGVRLALATAEAVGEAWHAIHAAVSLNAPNARLDGVLVTPMVPIELELLVGMIRDPQFGPAVAVGVGGAAVESLPDVAMRLLPVDRQECLELLADLQDRHVRALGAAERGALAEAIERFSAMAWDLRETLIEADVNPIALTRDGRAVALDALLCFRE